jgi:hypothetical protein
MSPTTTIVVRSGRYALAYQAFTSSSVTAPAVSGEGQLWYGSPAG